MITVTRTTRLAVAGRSFRRPSLHLQPLSSGTRRRLHGSPTAALPYKDNQDRQSLKPQSGESTQSGSDNDVARHHGEAAFDPNKTDPGTAKDTAGSGNADGGNPLDASPANQELSKPQGNDAAAKKRSEEGAGKGKRSHGESPNKQGKAA